MLNQSCHKDLMKSAGKLHLFKAVGAATTVRQSCWTLETTTLNTGSLNYQASNVLKKDGKIRCPVAGIVSQLNIKALSEERIRCHRALGGDLVVSVQRACDYIDSAQVLGILFSLFSLRR